jgi:hypothetical protein
MDESLCFTSEDVPLPDDLSIGDCLDVRTDFGRVDGPLGTPTDPETLLAATPRDDC